VLAALPKSVTRTVRLDEDLDHAIQQRAKDSRVTVNFLVNRAIRKLVEWDIPSANVGMVVVPSVLHDRLFDAVDEQVCRELGHSIAAEFYKPFAEFLFGEFSVNTAILLFKRMSEYGGRFVFDDSRDTRKYVVIIRHGSGQKMSHYYGGLIEGIFRDILGKQLKLQCTQALCIAQFDAS
jgi:hypothetical protein